MNRMMHRMITNTPSLPIETRAHLIDGDGHGGAKQRNILCACCSTGKKERSVLWYAQCDARRLGKCYSSAVRFIVLEFEFSS